MLAPATEKTMPEFSGGGGLTAEQLKEMRDIFEMFDEDGSGSISSGELGSVLESMGVTVSSDQLTAMIKEVDTPDGDGEICFDEFVALMMSKSASNDPIAEARRIFERFDADRSGSIDLDELRQAMRTMDPHLDDAEIERLVHECDDDGSGEVSFDEFCTLFHIPPEPARPASADKLHSNHESQHDRADRKPSRAEQAENVSIAKLRHVSVDEVQSLRETFWVFDTDASGSVNASELGEMMRSLGVHVTEHQLRDMIAQVDTDGGGEVEFSEFVHLMLTHEDQDSQVSHQLSLSVCRSICVSV